MNYRNESKWEDMNLLCEEYEKYRIQQNREYVSDFDRVFAKYLKGNFEEK